MLPEDGQVRTQTINDALSVIVGRPLAAASRAWNMARFAFGAIRLREGRKGKLVHVGEYVLHLGCPWRLVTDAEIVTGLGDTFLPGRDLAQWGRWDGKGVSRFELQVGAWLNSHSDRQRIVTHTVADVLGGFVISVTCGARLEVFPDNSMTGCDCEIWRLFEPGAGQHFVVYNDRLEGGTSPPRFGP
jgi:hypothetical protein